MKAKASKPLTSRQLKERNNYDRMSFVPVTQAQKKGKASSSIDANQYITFNIDKLAEIIKQIENVRKGLKILASEVKTLK